MVESTPPPSMSSGNQSQNLEAHPTRTNLEATPVSTNQESASTEAPMSSLPEVDSAPAYTMWKPNDQGKKLRSALVSYQEEALEYGSEDPTVAGIWVECVGELDAWISEAMSSPSEGTSWGGVPLLPEREICAQTKSYGVVKFLGGELNPAEGRDYQDTGNVSGLPSKRPLPNPSHDDPTAKTRKTAGSGVAVSTAWHKQAARLMEKYGPTETDVSAHGASNTPIAPPTADNIAGILTSYLRDTKEFLASFQPWAKDVSFACLEETGNGGRDQETLKINLGFLDASQAYEDHVNDLLQRLHLLENPQMPKESQ